MPAEIIANVASSERLPDFAGSWDGKATDCADFLVLIGGYLSGAGGDAEETGGFTLVGEGEMGRLRAVLSCCAGGLAGRGEVWVVATWGTTIGSLQPRHFVLRPAQSSGADNAMPQDGQTKRIMGVLPAGDSEESHHPYFTGRLFEWRRVALRYEEVVLVWQDDERGY